MKIGRNEPCPCGSNKKYKKCCYLKQTEVVNELNPNKIQIMCNVTGELFHPVRLHYKVIDKQGLQDVFNTIKCIESDTGNKRFVWLYTQEAKKLIFPVSYNDLPKHLHPIVIGSFFQSNEKDNEMFLDVRSPERAEHAVKFFDKHIERKYAELTHVSLSYRFIKQNPKNIDINFDKFFPTGHANENEMSRKKLKKILEDEKQPTRKEDALELLNSLTNKVYPETDKIKLFYYEDGLSQLTLELRTSSIVAAERMNGNEEVTHKNIMKKILS